LLVGINPAPASVRVGHYFQGSIGRRLWKRLESLELIKDAMPGREDVTFRARGHGLTDVVKRPTDSAAELTPRDFEVGVLDLRHKIAEWRPGLIVFVFKKAAQAALGRKDIPPGPGHRLEGLPTFLLSGPYASAKDRKRNDRELLQQIRKHVRDGTAA
jgi:TDG/mug DNA glycosylase family protein